MSRAIPVDWERIQTVLLDMDGTLLDLHFDNYFWQEHLPACWADQQGLDLVAAKRQLSPRFKQVEGTLAWYCLDFWSRELALNVLALKDEVQHKIRLRPHAERLLETLRRLGKQCVLVTNAHPAVLEYKLARTDLGRHFQSLYTAHAFGEPKESVRFWQMLENHLAFERSTTLLIDDNRRVLEAARDHGIQHLLSIVQPDSQQPPRTPDEFTAVADFRELFDPSGGQAATEQEVIDSVAPP